VCVCVCVCVCVHFTRTCVFVSVARGRLNGPCLDNGVCVVANSVCDNGQCVCSDDTFDNEGFCGKYLSPLCRRHNVDATE